MWIVTKFKNALQITKKKINDKAIHNQLRENLIEHLWHHHGDQY